MTQAASGDTVKASRGIFNEPLLVDSSTTLTLSGSWEFDFSSRDPVPPLTTIAGVDVLAGLGEVVDVTVDGFIVTLADGVAAISTDDAMLTLRLANCVVKNNLSGGGYADDMGGVSTRASGSSTLNLEITNSVMSANRTFWGVSLLTADTSSGTLTMSDSIVKNTWQGGGHGVVLFANGMASLVAAMTRTRIERNQIGLLMSADEFAGAAAIATHTDVSVIRNRDMGISSGGTLSLSNSVVSRNRGGGMGAGGPTTIVNSTFTGNRTPCEDVACSGGVTILTTVGSVITNTIVWGNRARGLAHDDLFSYDASLDIDHSDLGDAGGFYTDLGGNISVDPLLRSRRDPHLSAGSPAIDTGTCSGAPATDFEGDARPTGAGCDMGADEFVP
jgi:hypothetical protein